MDKDDLRVLIGKKLAQDYDYDEILAYVDLNKESELLAEEFFNLCEEGVNKFEAFVKVFY